MKAKRKQPIYLVEYRQCAICPTAWEVLRAFSDINSARAFVKQQRANDTRNGIDYYEYRVDVVPMAVKVTMP